MKTTGYKDVHGQEIRVGMKCIDQINQVDDIEIIEVNGQYFAKPSGLDGELLSDVHKGLVISSR
ncbi:Phage protein [Brevibacillus sp. IT-7CA2]|uniref:hypothetical protein n=1 Tax=Brevibacillus sp. IT-7CA2 TaxID=3026436 RepID=UPI0039DFC9E7